MATYSFHVTVPHSRLVRETDAASGRTVTRREELPSTRERVSIAIDVEGLVAELGPRACLAKGGRSVEAGGLVVCKRIKDGKS